MNFSAPIRAVTFDAGGTLIEPWPSVGHVYAEVAAKHGQPGISPEVLNRNFAEEWKKKRDFQHTEADWAGLVDSTFADLLESPPSRTFFPALYGRFAEPGAWRICDDVLPTLDELASRQLPLAVVSNWDERLRPLLERLRLNRYFDTIIVSCEVAFAKPSPVIFEVAAQRLGIPPENILHVGDSRAEDLDGARSAGFQALVIDRRSNDVDAGTIASLEDLASLL
jgi:putative hydrolase of the HAD superfamily